MADEPMWPNSWDKRALAAEAKLAALATIGKRIADRWFDQFGDGMKQSRAELAAMIDDEIQRAARLERKGEPR